MSLANSLLRELSGPRVDSIPDGLVQFARIFEYVPGGIQGTHNWEEVEHYIWDDFGAVDGAVNPLNPYHIDPIPGRAFPDAVLIGQEVRPPRSSDDRNYIVIKEYHRATNEVWPVGKPLVGRDEFDRKTLRQRYVILHDAPESNKEGEIGIDTWPGDPTLVLSTENREEQGGIDFVTRTFVQATEELQQVGEVEVDVQEDGTSYRITYVQLHTAPYVPGVTGTTSHNGVPMDREIKRGNDSVRTIVRYFGNSRLSSVERYEKFPGTCAEFKTISVRIPKGQSYTPPSNWVLIDKQEDRDTAGNVVGETRTYQTVPPNVTTWEETKYAYPGFKNVVMAGGVSIVEGFAPRTRIVDAEVTIEFFRQPQASARPSRLAIQFELIEDLQTEIEPSPGSGLRGGFQMYRNYIGGIIIEHSANLGYREDGASNPNIYPGGLQRVESSVQMWRCGFDGQVIWVRRSVRIPFLPNFGN